MTATTSPDSPSSRPSHGARRAAAGLAAAALLLAACGSSHPSAKSSSSATSTTGSSTATGAPIAGGTVTFAEGPSTPPNYIFPLISAQHSSYANISQFQVLMYRPLYWFGNNNTASVDFNYSVGNRPVWSDHDQTVTITLKHYMWSNGQPVTSRDVEFWINLVKADPANFYGYVQGLFPENVASMQLPNAQTIVLHLTQPYNPDWYLYNQLSEITPLPLAWDRTSLSAPAPSASSPNLPDTTKQGALAVYNFLAGQATDEAAFVKSPIWSVVDGPWKLTAFTVEGAATFEPNPSYTGPDKPRIAKFVEEPFTSDYSEFNLLTGSPGSLTVGYVPPQDLPQEKSVLAGGYRPSNSYVFAVGYFPLNLNNPKVGPIFRQLYFRQAFQHLVNQQGWISAFYHGTAVPDYGPVPSEPPNHFANENQLANPYPFSVSDAARILTRHGWKVVPGGRTTCVRPGTGPTACGAGISAGEGISFNLDYTYGEQALALSMRDLTAEAALVGIQIHLTTHPYATVVSTITPCSPSQSICQWTAENWGGGWSFAPDYYPSGEELWATGASANYENYSNPVADRLIRATTKVPSSESQAAMDAYEAYIAKQLPVVWQPEEGGNPIQGFPAVVSTHLGGYVPNAYQFITPEQWYLTK